MYTLCLIQKQWNCITIMVYPKCLLSFFCTCASSPGPLPPPTMTRSTLQVIPWLVVTKSRCIHFTFHCRQSARPQKHHHLLCGFVKGVFAEDPRFGVCWKWVTDDSRPDSLAPASRKLVPSLPHGGLVWPLTLPACLVFVPQHVCLKKPFNWRRSRKG